MKNRPPRFRRVESGHDPAVSVTNLSKPGTGSSRGRVVRWVAWSMVVWALVLGVALSSRFGTDPGSFESPLIGQPAPDLELPLLDGSGSVALTGFSSDAVVVNFWASWCVPCRREHPALLATASSFGDAGVRFVGIVYQDDPQAAIEFLDELGWGENYSYVTDPGSLAAIEFGIFGIPETFFIDPQGIIVGKITGESDVLMLGTTLDRVLQGGRPGQQTAGTVQGGP